MNTIDILKNKLDQMSKDLYYLADENKKLKRELALVKDKNDLFIRNSEDIILTIRNKLKLEKNVE